MYEVVAKKFVLPWTILSAIVVSIILYLVTGSVKLIPHAQAASIKTNPSTVIASVVEQIVIEDGQTETAPAIGSNTQITETTFELNPLECAVDSRFPHTVRQWCGLITRYSKQNDLDPDLVAALIWQESGGNPVAFSKSGAVGLMQVMPRDGISASFQCKNGPCFKNRPTINELEDPEFNVSYGTGMLSELIHHHGNLRDALKAYGPMDVGYYYADKVLSLKSTYGD